MRKKRPFIADQRMRILQVDGNPREYLSAEYFRQLRLAGDQETRPFGEHRQAGPWQPVARREVWQGIRDRKFMRVVIVTDAGIGKSTTMGWLNYKLNQPGGPPAARCEICRKAENP